MFRWMKVTGAVLLVVGGAPFLNPSPVSATTGSLDASFNPRGNPPGVISMERGVKFGTAQRLVPTTGGDMFAVSGAAVYRLHSDGSLDTTFAGGGPTPGSVALFPDVYAYDATVLPDGSLIEQDATGLWKISASGVIDASFGRPQCAPPCVPILLPDGFISLTTRLGGALAVAPDGKILAVGQDSETNGVSVSRVLASGATDASWGPRELVPGKVVLPLAGRGVGVWANADGSASVLASLDDSRMALIRFTTSGGLDPTFGGGTGYVAIDIGSTFGSSAESAELDSAGRIVVSGDAIVEPNAYPFLARFDLSGHLDPTFSPGSALPGLRFTNLPVRRFALDPMDRIVAASASGGRPVLIRFNSDGTLDRSFDANGPTPGVSTFDVPSTLAALGEEWGYLSDVLVDAIGRPVAVGSVLTKSWASEGYLVRFRPDGDGDGVAHPPNGPERLLDTRPGVGHRGYSGPKPSAGQTVVVDVSSTGTVPTDASAVLVNVTGTEATADGYVTVWPCGSPRPVASNLNLVQGGTSPNLVFAKVGANHSICVFTQSGAHLIADVVSWQS